MATGYGKRTGVTTLRVAVKALCHLLLAYQPKIERWITLNQSFSNAATVIAWLNGASAVCTILLATPDD